ncbi:site-specific integrase [Rhodospirillaceae bacterium SYSU D60014]|uniref:tyrosine-type recombinase/integrase n=1 Tax=Virgifigura deserti TaxID=2268457 RepID=UPI000E670FE7
MKLTKSRIQALAYEGDGKSRDVRWDDTQPGFGVRVYPSGRKAFVLSYRVHGRKRLMALGDFGPLTLEKAREWARKYIVQVEEGKDPLDEKRKAAVRKTLDDLIKKYISDHAKVHKKTWAKDERRLNNHIPADWLGRKAASITRDEIADLHKRIGKRAPYEANRLLEILRKMFKLARVWHIIDETAPNPATDITRFREKKRKRWVLPEEVPALAAAIDAEPNIYIRGALWTYLLVGVRKTELLQAKRTDVDWNRALLRLPDTKAGDEQHAPLNGPTVALFQALPAIKDNPYLFPGAKKGKHLVNIWKAWDRIRQAAGVEDVRLHDLRRTVGSWMTQAKVDLNTIKDALRHANISTTLTYARLGADPAREAIEEHGQRILAAAKKAEAAEVVRLRG